MTSERELLLAIVELARPHGNWRNPTLKAAIAAYDESKRASEPKPQDEQPYDGSDE